MDLQLPVADAEFPRFHASTFEESLRYNERMWPYNQYDAAYFEWSVARKNDVPFEM